MLELEDSLKAVEQCRIALDTDVFATFHKAIEQLKKGLEPKNAKTLWQAIGKTALETGKNDSINARALAVGERLKELIPNMTPFQEEITNLRKSLAEVITHREESIDQLSMLPLPIPYTLKDLEDVSKKIDELEIKANIQLNAAMVEIETWLVMHRAATPPPQFVLNMDAALERVTRPQDIVWDASFMKEVSAFAQKSGYAIEATEAHRISTKVEAELIRHSGETLQPLTGRKLLNYLFFFGATRILDKELKVTPREENDIIATWKSSSPKASKTPAERFKGSGNYDILRYCYKQSGGKKDIIVLSQDADIRKTIAEFKRRGKLNDVSVYEMQDGKVVKAA